MSMSPRDWQDMASVYKAGAKQTWGVSDASTHHLGIVLDAMAKRCQEIAGSSLGEMEAVRAEVTIEPRILSSTTEVVDVEIPAGLTGNERAQAVINAAADYVTEQVPWGAEEVTGEHGD